MPRRNPTFNIGDLVKVVLDTRNLPLGRMGRVNGFLFDKFGTDHGVRVGGLENDGFDGYYMSKRFELVTANEDADPWRFP